MRYIEDEVWGVRLEPNLKYSLEVKYPFRVTNAALDAKINSQKRGTVSVLLKDSDRELVLCSLIPSVIEQQQLNLTFVEGEDVTFLNDGENTVHLLGNFLSVCSDEEMYGSDDSGLGEELEYFIESDEVEMGEPKIQEVMEAEAGEESVPEVKEKKPKSKDKRKKRKPEEVVEASEAVEPHKEDTVEIEEVTAGKRGPQAKPGRRVSVVYKGTVNGKVFDSNDESRPLEFQVGDGSVIKGFDLGVRGMTLNAVRRITVPPSLGYGGKGGSKVPKNVPLTFEIKLVKIK